MAQQPRARPDSRHCGRFGKFLHTIKRKIGRTPSPDPSMSILSSPTRQPPSATQPNLLPPLLPQVSPTTTPLPSVSANPYQSLLPFATRPPSSSGTEDGAGHADRSALSTGLATLRSVVSAVKEVSDPFPPLKAATAGFLIILDRIDVRLFKSLCIPLTND